MSAVAGAADVHPETIAASVEGRSPRQIFWARFRQDRAAMVGGVVIVMLLLLALFAGVIANLIGHGPNDVYDSMTDDFGIPKGPNSRFWFGADGSGRDLFVRVLYGARTSLLVGAHRHHDLDDDRRDGRRHRRATTAASSTRSSRASATSSSRCRSCCSRSASRPPAA